MNVCVSLSDTGCSGAKFEYEMGDEVSGNEKEGVAGGMYDKRTLGYGRYTTSSSRTGSRSSYGSKTGGTLSGCITDSRARSCEGTVKAWWRGMGLRLSRGVESTGA
jgi:hypothetical protein